MKNSLPTFIAAKDVVYILDRAKRTITLVFSQHMRDRIIEVSIANNLDKIETVRYLNNFISEVLLSISRTEKIPQVEMEMFRIILHTEKGKGKK